MREDRPDDCRIVERGDEAQPAPTGWTRQHVNRKRALDNVRDKFRRTQGGRAIELDYLIYCPAHRLVGINAAALDTSRVVDATQRAQLPERIEACLGPGNPDREAWAEMNTSASSQPRGRATVTEGVSASPAITAGARAGPARG